MKMSVKATLCLLAMLAVGSMAAKTRVIVSLGDDQSDRGNTYAVSQLTIPDNETYFEGSWTNEPGVWTRQIDTPESVISMRDFGYGGATACANAELKAQGVLTLPDQVADWQEKVSNPAYVDSLQGVNATRPAILTIWAGHNDLIMAAMNGTVDGVADQVSQCIAEVTRSMLETTEVQFQAVVLMTLAPIDLAPVVVETGNADAVKTAVDAINQQINALADELSGNADNTTVVLVDVNSAVLAAAGNFSEPTAPCVTYTGDYVPIEGGEVASKCDNPNDHIWYDIYHPSAAVHSAVVDAVAQGLIDAGVITALEDTPAAGPAPAARKLRML